jgi:cytochrome P450
MRELDTAIGEIADDLLDRIEARGTATFDFIKEFANPLPASVIMDLLGVPREDMILLRDWSMQLQPSSAALPFRETNMRAGGPASSEWPTIFGRWSRNEQGVLAKMSSAASWRSATPARSAKTS